MPRLLVAALLLGFGFGVVQLLSVTPTLRQPLVRRISGSALVMSSPKALARPGDDRGRRGGRRGGRARAGRGRRARGRGRGGRSSPTEKPAVGDTVAVVEKANYGTEKRTVGVVARVLTRSASHHRGFKVMLQSGVVGRCTQLIERGTADACAADDEDINEQFRVAVPPPGIRLADSTE